MSLVLFLLFFISLLCLFILVFLNLKVHHHYCVGFILEDCLFFRLMPIDIEQLRAEIGNFNGYSQHSIVKLYLNFFNLLSYIALIFICIFVLTLSLTTKLQTFWYFTLSFLCGFASSVSVSIFRVIFFSSFSLRDHLQATCT